LIWYDSILEGFGTPFLWEWRLSTATARFKAEQSQMFPCPASDRFSLNDPPSIGWWQANLGLNLASTVFIFHYQSVVGTKSFTDDRGLSWQSNYVPVWQAASGISPKQWDGAKRELGGSEAPLLLFQTAGLAGIKAAKIRPTERFLAIFGLTLAAYDIATQFNARIAPLPRGTRRRKAPPEAPNGEDWQALGLWGARGGWSKLPSWEVLKEKYEEWNAGQTRLTACSPYLPDPR
jgi:hypothetical protein